MSDELDIIDRLRNEVDMCNNDGVYDIAILCNDAIEEIDRLSKTVKTLTNEANDPGDSRLDWDDLNKFIDDTYKDNDFIVQYGGGGLYRYKGLVTQLLRERSGAYEIAGSLIEHVIISLRALHMIAKASYGLTHRQRNARLDVLCDTIEETIAQMVNDRENYHSFGYTPFSRKDWDTRRLASENLALRRQLDELLGKNQKKKDLDDIPF